MHWAPTDHEHAPRFTLRKAWCTLSFASWQGESLGLSGEGVLHARPGGSGEKRVSKEPVILVPQNTSKVMMWLLNPCPKESLKHHGIQRSKGDLEGDS